MFKINSVNNQITSLQTKSFTELGFREREHLQEWIAKLPSCLGEELLIIQKEFSDFNDTQERLDLLALDKQGSLVIIENKLDDTGRDVTWQALKYASYCSGFSKDNIRKIYQDFLDKSANGEKAEENLIDFFDGIDYEEIILNKGVTQRVILIAANFRKEVTSTVLWLLNFKLRVQCFKVTPYSMGEELFLSVDQIIPTKDTEEFMMGLADKAQDEIIGVTQEKNRHIVRRKFWGKLLSEMNKESSLFKNISAGKNSWINKSSDISGVLFSFDATRSYGSASLYIGRGKVTENEFIFNRLFEQKEKIEESFGGDLIWEKLDGKRACRIKAEQSGNIFKNEQWGDMIEFMTDAMVRLENAVRDPIKKIKESQ
ncbi:MAG: DUF4268 domain-containing protein [Alphaproteobacteria bacterium]|nr:DUF4268 domain-containing protein [Alphaproteobacteria bacterium]